MGAPEEWNNTPQLVVTLAAQFLTVCSTSTLAVELRVSSPFSRQFRARRKAALRQTRTHIPPLQPTTTSDKLRDLDNHHAMRSRWASSASETRIEPSTSTFLRPLLLPKRVRRSRPEGYQASDGQHQHG